VKGQSSWTATVVTDLCKENSVELYNAVHYTSFYISEQDYM